MVSFNHSTTLDIPENVSEASQIRMEQLRLLNTPSFASVIATSFAALIFGNYSASTIKAGFFLSNSILRA